MVATTRQRVRCAWPNCDHLDDSETNVGIDMGDGDMWCLCHLLDDALPAVEDGWDRRECARCGEPTSWRTGAGVHLHPDCRRVWAMAQDARPAMGAYARRGK